jgi:alpha-ketoglutarate-dependent 2,4-dichlorophenoxyacetate dioxygenase
MSLSIEVSRFLASWLVLGESRTVNETGEDAPMEIVPLGPGFAAELRGVTLAEIAADDAAYAAARTAFEEHSVLVFHGQDVCGSPRASFSTAASPWSSRQWSRGAPGSLAPAQMTIPQDPQLPPKCPLVR